MVDDTVHDQAKNSAASVFDEAVRMTDYNEGAVPAGVGVSYGPVMYAPIEITGSNGQ